MLLRFFSSFKNFVFVETTVGVFPFVVLVFRYSADSAAPFEADIPKLFWLISGRIVPDLDP